MKKGSRSEGDTRRGVSWWVGTLSAEAEQTRRVCVRERQRQPPWNANPTGRPSGRPRELNNHLSVQCNARCRGHVVVPQPRPDHRNCQVPRHAVDQTAARREPCLSHVEWFNCACGPIRRRVVRPGAACPTPNGRWAVATATAVRGRGLDGSYHAPTPPRRVRAARYTRAAAAEVVTGRYGTWCRYVVRARTRWPKTEPQRVSR